MTYPTLRVGDVSPDVGRAQARLAAHGCRLSIDNDFGPATRAAVVAIQRVHGLPDDGVIGPRTWGVLLAGPASRVPTATIPLPDVPEPRRAVLARAIADLGAAESPAGSNRGPAIDHLDPAGRPWCALACSAWIRLGTGAASWEATPMGRQLARVRSTPGVWSWEGWARGARVWSETPEVGAVHVMGRRGSASDGSSDPTAGHCGLVVEVRGDRVVTIDGNVGDRVSRVERPLGTVLGYVRWWAP
jgi:peptidoglycan hydrolase-like protein with peptidoglycan-binding domain